MDQPDERPDQPPVAGGSQRPTADADESLPYEQARDQLVEVVRRLETGGSTLEESLALWERGERLAAICQRWLDGARARLDQARASARNETEAGVPTIDETEG